MKVKLAITLEVDAEQWANLFLDPSDKDVRSDVLHYFAHTIDDQIERASLPVKAGKLHV